MYLKDYTNRKSYMVDEESAKDLFPKSYTLIRGNEELRVSLRKYEDIKFSNCPVIKRWRAVWDEEKKHFYLKTEPKAVKKEKSTSSDTDVIHLTELNEFFGI